MRRWPGPQSIMVLTLAAIILAGLLAFPARADISIRRQLTLYLTSDDRPYRAPLDYAILCFGYDWDPGPDPEFKPGSYTPEIVYRFSAHCPRYGCKTTQDTYLNYRHIDRCDLQVTSGIQQVTLEAYSSFPFGSCRDGKLSSGDQLCELRLDIPELAQPDVEDAAPSSPLESTFLIALALTWLVEVIAIIIVARFVLRLTDASLLRTAGIALLASALTLPYLWFVAPSVLPGGWWWVIGEGLVVLVEAVIYRFGLPCRWRDALLLAAIANAASFAVGWFLV